MSHSKERHEKICLNCNAELHGRYCHQCGQENIEPKETVWGLVSHFFYDITHFDGKFFKTTGTLIKKPGLLPKEYIAGRRARYLHPIRMYVFSSAVFFLAFFSIAHVNHIPGADDAEEGMRKADSIINSLDSAKLVEMAKTALPKDSAIIAKDFEAAKQVTTQATTGSYRYHGGDSMAKADTTYTKTDSSHTTDTTAEPGSARPKRKKRVNTEIDLDGGMWVNGQEIFTIAEYDSIQARLPADERDGWLERRLNIRNLELKQKYKGDGEAILKDLLNKFFHTIPYLLFISLPLYALYLKLLYVRRKQFFYVDHGIWLIYLYIYTFLLLLVVFLIEKARDGLDWQWLMVLEVLLLCYGIWYAYKSQRKFYGQGTGKTLLKFLAFNFLTGITIIFLFVLFFVVSVFQL